MEEDLRDGDEFAGHRIETEIGRGGMGVVYRARHLALDRVRALKVLAPRLADDQAYADRFRRECRLAASVEHPNVVTVHHAGEEQGRLFMSMQLVDGVDLGRLLADGPLPLARSIDILDDLAAGLDAAHAVGLIHRDVKPENVLIGGDPGAERAYLTDFGIGTLAEVTGRRTTRLTGRGVVLGTADYIAPEQIRGDELDGRADIYSLGCVGFHMLTGRPPFAASTELAVLAAHGSAPRPQASALDPSIGPAVDEALARAMAVGPDDRPVSADEFMRLLRGAVDGRSRPERAEPRERDTVPITKREPRTVRTTLAISLAAVAVVAVAAVAAWLVIGGGESDDGAGGGNADGGPFAIQAFPAPRDPVALAVGAESVWVAGRDSDFVTPLDPERDGAVGRRYRVENPRSLALGFGQLWGVGADSLFRLNPADEEVTEVIPLEDPSDVAVDRRGVWVLDRGQQPRVLRVDPDSLTVTGEAFVGDDPRSLAAGAGSIWVTNTAEGTVSRIDPRSARVVGSPIEVGGRPTNVAARAGAVWVVDNFGGRLIPIAPSSSPTDAPVVGEALATASRPRGIAIGFGSVWVSSEEGIVQRFGDGADDSLAGTADVGANPADVEIGAGGVWTADQGSSTVSRITP